MRYIDIEHVRMGDTYQCGKTLLEVPGPPAPINPTKEIPMAQFYGAIQGSRGEATRLGGKASGMQATAAGWQGAIKVTTWFDDEQGVDRFEIKLTPWQNGSGSSRILAEGVLDASAKAEVMAGRVVVEG